MKNLHACCDLQHTCTCIVISTIHLCTQVTKHKRSYLKNGLNIVALALKCLVTTPRNLFFCLEHERQFRSTELARLSLPPCWILRESEKNLVTSDSNAMHAGKILSTPGPQTELLLYCSKRCQKLWLCLNSFKKCAWSELLIRERNFFRQTSAACITHHNTLFGVLL